MEIYAQVILNILQREPENLRREISPNNAKHHKQEALILVTTSVVQINLIILEQSPENFCFEIIGMGLGK